MDKQTPLIRGAASFLCSLRHPHVLPVLWHLCKPAAQCSQDCKCCLEVLLDAEYCNGGTLADAIQQGLFCRSVVREQWAIATSVLCDVAHGMHFLHSQRVCHGHLNPENIQLQVSAPYWRGPSMDSCARMLWQWLSCRMGVKCMCVQADLLWNQFRYRLQIDEESHFSIGAAVAAGAAQAKVANLFTCPVATEPGDVSSIGSQDSQHSVFVAPEMQGGTHYTKANDIYSFGVLMWVLLTGRPVRDKLCAPPCLSPRAMPVRLHFVSHILSPFLTSHRQPLPYVAWRGLGSLGGTRDGQALHYSGHESLP